MESAFNRIAAQFTNYLNNGRWPKIKSLSIPEEDDGPMANFEDGDAASILILFKFMGKKLSVAVWFDFIHDYIDQYMNDFVEPENNSADIANIENTNDSITVDIEDCSYDSTAEMIKDKFSGVFSDWNLDKNSFKSELVRINVKSDESVELFFSFLDKIEKEIL